MGLIIRLLKWDADNELHFPGFHPGGLDSHFVYYACMRVVSCLFTMVRDDGGKYFSRYAQ
jgi:hypothetical protein